jgi:hypothetical protein
VQLFYQTYESKLLLERAIVNRSMRVLSSHPSRDQKENLRANALILSLEWRSVNNPIGALSARKSGSLITQ